MATKIEWTQETWNPLHGCTKVSEACKNCYAVVMANRLRGRGVRGYEKGFRLTLHPWELETPFKWKKPRMVFVCSMGDLFHEDVPFEYIDQVMNVIRRYKRHTFQILTKRPERMAEYFSYLVRPVPNNAWLGTTCESPEHYDRIAALTSIEMCHVKFLSCEPLLGYMWDIPLENIDWVIAGGESGVRARKTPVEWFRTLRDRCIETETPFFFKQWGAYGEDGTKRNKKDNGSMLDGREWKQMPRQ